jgi:hypothetical protein
MLHNTISVKKAHGSNSADDMPYYFWHNIILFHAKGAAPDISIPYVFVSTVYLVLHPLI